MNLKNKSLNKTILVFTFIFTLFSFYSMGNKDDMVRQVILSSNDVMEVPYQHNRMIQDSQLSYYENEIKDLFGKNYSFLYSLIILIFINYIKSVLVVGLSIGVYDYLNDKNKPLYNNLSEESKIVQRSFDKVREGKPLTDEEERVVSNKMKDLGL